MSPGSTQQEGTTSTKPSRHDQQGGLTHITGNTKYFALFGVSKGNSILPWGQQQYGAPRNNTTRDVMTSLTSPTHTIIGTSLVIPPYPIRPPEPCLWCNFIMAVKGRTTWRGKGSQGLTCPICSASIPAVTQGLVGLVH